MCSLMEHSDRSYREKIEAERETPLFVKVAREHGYQLWPIP